VEPRQPDAEGYEPGPEAVPLEEALAWARERTDAILIRVGDRRHLYSAGGRPLPDARPWPPPDLGPLVRRRDPFEAWKDRTDDDPAVAWNVHVVLSLTTQTTDEAVVGDDAPIEAFARSTGAQSWDREPLDGYLADMERAAPGGFWSTSHAPAWRVYYRVEAPTREAATASVLARIGDPPGGLEIAATALPAWDVRATFVEAERAAFAAFAATHKPTPGPDPLLSALDALAETEVAPQVDQLMTFVERHGVELGDNHFATTRTQWLPVLEEVDERSLLLEVDEYGRVDSAAVVRVDFWRQLG
jgi:hypothetical protein